MDSPFGLGVSLMDSDSDIQSERESQSIGISGEAIAPESEERAPEGQLQVNLSILLPQRIQVNLAETFFLDPSRSSLLPGRACAHHPAYVGPAIACVLCLARNMPEEMCYKCPQCRLWLFFRPEGAESQEV